MNEEDSLSMARINKNFGKLASGYLFPEIAKRTRAFLDSNPGVEVMRLGIGNTTEPLTPAVISALRSGVDKLGDVETYTGYADGSEGNVELREALAAHYGKMSATIDPDEIFVSDGAKSDSANIQSIFGLDNVVAVQDPAYPVYVESNVMAGRTGNREEDQYKGLVYMPCTEENGFFPDLPKQKVDLIYVCSPNNPTGAVATRENLEGLVDFATRHLAVIFFDAAYAPYISDPDLPRSIYEIPGAKRCAIEISSFSKIAGFTGVRLGWSVVPADLVAEDAEPGTLRSMWTRRQNTMFNGASNIVQEGGLGVLSEAGQRECGALASYYMENAALIRQAVEALGLKVFGGRHAPYVWIRTPGGMSSWAFFDKLLSEAHVVGTPGTGFGPSGEGYFRLSAFGHREDVARAVKSLEENLKL